MQPTVTFHLVPGGGRSYPEVLGELLRKADHTEDVVAQPPDGVRVPSDLYDRLDSDEGLEVVDAPELSATAQPAPSKPATRKRSHRRKSAPPAPAPAQDPEAAASTPDPAPPATPDPTPDPGTAGTTQE